MSCLGDAVLLESAVNGVAREKGFGAKGFVCIID